jgi:mono/diheme cytochrome c family protein
MKARKLAFITILLTLIFVVTACSSGATTTTTSSSSTTLDGATLFQERCSTCHAAPTNARGTAQQWTSVVQMMVARGAQLNQAEQKAVIDYLVANYSK